MEMLPTHDIYIVSAKVKKLTKNYSQTRENLFTEYE